MAGTVTDHPVERYNRDARVTERHEGTRQIHTNVVADRLQ